MARPQNEQPNRDARAIAVRVLARVLEDDAWAAPMLAAEFSRARLDARDSSLSTEIVYGTLRTLPTTDALLAPYLKKPKSLDGFARAALRSAAYQLRFLERVPAFAVVNETVSIVRAARGARLAGLANAVLRKLAAAVEGMPAGAPPSRFEVPVWLTTLLGESMPEERLSAFLGTRPLPPPIGLRTRRPREEVADALNGWAEENKRPRFSVRVGEAATRSLLVKHGGNPEQWPGYAEGHFVLQEQGSQALVEALPLEGTERVLDACAGRGNKSLALLDRLSLGHVTAVDLYQEKLEALEVAVERLGFRLGAAAGELGTMPLDLTVGTGALKTSSFDGVLVDAPCSGLGTIHRRPELLLRLTPARFQEAAELQHRLLETTCRLVAPGGWLAFAVCSPSREEGQWVAERWERDQPGFQRVSVPGCDDDQILRLGPWSDDCDGYQLVLWRRDP